MVLACPASVLAQKLDVKIFDRQDNETEYTYVVPGHFSSQSHSYANCNGNDNNLNCNGSTTTNGYSMPAHQVSYHVRGATFSLQLPDERIVVVNCESKFRERMAGPAGRRKENAAILDKPKVDPAISPNKMEAGPLNDKKQFQEEVFLRVIENQKLPRVLRRLERRFSDFCPRPAMPATT